MNRKMTPENGGAALPQEARADYFGGLSRQEYFMAHAPASVPEWFHPTMPPPPIHPKPLAWTTESEKQWLDGLLSDCYSPNDIEEPRVRAYAEAREEFHKARLVWNEEYAKQLSLQWPAAWAAEMLKRSAP